MQLKLKQNPQNASVFVRKQFKPKPLNHILQLTQENQTCRQNKDDLLAQKIKLIKKQGEQFVQIQEQGWRKYFCCVNNLCKILTKDKKGEGKQMDVNQSEFTEFVQKIRSKKSHCDVVLPPQKQSKRILVLDLDQTLIHTSFNKPQKYDFQTQINFNDKVTIVYSVKRFGLDAFLFQMSKIYELIIFTASQKQYADKVVQQIDPKKRISHVLNRDHCIVINKLYYLKNLKILGRDLKQTIMIDDNKMAGILQPENFYKIDQFLGNPKDRKLVQLTSFLKNLNQTKYILPIFQSRRKFQDIQIKIKDENITKSRSMQQSYRKSLHQKKRQYRHKKTNSEVQSLVTADTQQSQHTETDVEKDQTSKASQRNQAEQQATGHSLIRKDF